MPVPGVTTTAVVAGGDVRAQHREDLVDAGLLTAGRRRRPDVQLDRRLVAELAQRPPGVPAGAGPGRHVVELQVPRRSQSVEVDRGVTAHRRRRPGGFEELAAGLDQVRRPSANLLRIADQQRRLRGQMVAEQGKLGRPQQRQQCLHAVDGDTLAELGQHVGHAARNVVARRRVLRGELERTDPNVVGEQQFAAGHGDHHVYVDVGDRPLIRDREHPHLGDLVAPELGPDRVFGGGWEHVEDSAAHRELPTLADHVDPGVRQLHQPGDDVVELGFLSDGQGDRFDARQVRRHRLQQRAHRRGHDPQRRPETLIVGIGQPAQHHQPLSDRVDAGRQPFVRQRFPGREQRRRVTENAAQFGGQVVGLAPSRGDDKQRAGLGERGCGQHPGAGRADEGQIGGPVGGTAGDVL